MKIVGCDLHTRYQQVAMLEEETGELIEGRLEDESGEARSFYAALAAPVRVGIEATGHTRWGLAHLYVLEAVTKLVLSAKADSVCSTFAFPALPCRPFRCRRYAAGAEFVPPSRSSIEFRNSFFFVKVGTERSGGNFLDYTVLLGAFFINPKEANHFPDMSDFDVVEFW